MFTGVSVGTLVGTAPVRVGPTTGVVVGTLIVGNKVGVGPGVHAGNVGTAKVGYGVGDDGKGATVDVLGGVDVDAG